MLPRTLEPEVMDTPDDARAYDSMDHTAVNQLFVSDLLSFQSSLTGPVLDLGTGTAQIPIELCRRADGFTVIALDAAPSMLALARKNVAQAGFERRITLREGNARRLSVPDRSIPAILANSIHHHIPEPFEVFAEIVRVVAPGGIVFVRDLIRPADESLLADLVNLHAAGANDYQRKLFADSLRAALTVAEVRSLVERLGFSAESVQATSDRHWTWAATAR